MKGLLKKTILLFAATILSAPAFAVTDKEMDEARAITAKAYLRYANDGSGYLDDITVKSMTDLKSKLKPKEVENLKAFSAVQVPSDYASWDKTKLVEFWSVTFFSSPGLEAKGKLAKNRVKRQIEAMNVAAPAPAAEASEAKAPEAAPVADTAASAAMPTAESAEAQQADILSDQNAIQEDAEAAEEQTVPEQSHTWVYVLVLVLLIAAVLGLVIYAANLMKKQPNPEKQAEGADVAELREQARKAIAAKCDEVEQLKKRLEREEIKAADLAKEMERMKLDRSRGSEQVDRLRDDNIKLAAENTRMREEIASLREKISSLSAAPAAATTRAERRTQREPQREPQEEKPILKVIYLGRANSRGIFVRGDRRLSPGNTIYRLDTNDGLVGTFHVVDEPEVVDLALSNPTEYLGAGCTGEDLEDTTGVARIVTESAGTAIFENGYWKVLRKSRIRYE